MRTLIPIAGNQLATLLLGLVGLKLISEFVPPEINGAYAIFLTLTQIGVLITHSGIINHGTRYWQRESSRLGPYSRFLWQASWRALKYLAPLLLIIAAVQSQRQQAWTWILLFPILVLSNWGVALQMVALGVLNAAQKPWRVFWLNLAANAARIVFPVGFALGTSMTLAGLSGGYVIHGLLIIAVIVALFQGAIHADPAPPAKISLWLEELKNYGRPFVWMGVGTWLLQSADRWVVLQFFGAEQAGFFAYASSIGAIVPTLVMGGLMQLYFPSIFAQSDQARTSGDWRKISGLCDRVTLIFLLLTIGGLYALTWIAPLLVGPLINARYLSALDVIGPAGLAMVTVQANQFYYLLLQGQHNSAGMVKVMLVVAGVKTLGSIMAALISWPALIGWLMLSLPVSLAAGRTLIRGMALRPDESENLKSG